MWLMLFWVLVNLFDLLVTSWAVGIDRAYEANPVMAYLLQFPPSAVAVKFALTLVVVWLVHRVEQRTPFSGVWPMLAADVYVAWACLHNVLVLLGQESPFLRVYPLAGLPW